MSHITVFIVQWNPINTVTNGLEKFGHNNQVTRINEVTIRWGSTVPLPSSSCLSSLLMVRKLIISKPLKIKSWNSKFDLFTELFHSVSTFMIRPDSFVDTGTTCKGAFSDSRTLITKRFSISIAIERTCSQALPNL